MTKSKVVTIPGQPGIVRAGAVIEASARNSKKHKSGIRYRDARLENARPFRWVWDQRVLLEYFNLVVGEEGVGKGNLIAWLLAQVTRGSLPGDLKGTPSKVAVVGDEDSFENIWVPRLEAAGARLPQVKYIEAGETDDVLDVHGDAEALREFITEKQIKVVYFDQLFDNLGTTDTWKDKQVRDALAPLRRIAQVAHIAVIAAIHPNKRNGANFRDRVSGTSAFNALSRSSLLVAKHPHDDDRRVAVRPKGNYSAEPPGFEFRIEQVTVDIPKTRYRRRDLIVTTSRITDTRDTAIRASDVLDPRTDRKRDDSQRGIARKALTAMFAEDPSPRRAKVIVEELSKIGVSPRAISDAAGDLGIRKYQGEGFPAPWWWAPPEAE